ncbi:MAG: amino acid ABC transporter ATP-binding protein [Lachnospiraceae bacterium]
MDKLIHVQSLSKSFGDTTILNNLTLTVKKGEVIGIIGASGSGKSTLIRCIAGLEDYQSGSIYIDDEKQNGINKNHKIGVVFQNYNLFPHYNVLDNIAKPLQAVGKLSKAEAQTKARSLLAKVHLETIQLQYPSTLSGGQKQRVAIARALAMNPEIIIFDEATSALDPELAHEVLETIGELAREGQTMLVVTHQINAIRQIATRFLFLHKGQIEKDGAIQELFEKNTCKPLEKFLQMVDN